MAPFEPIQFAMDNSGALLIGGVVLVLLALAWEAYEEAEDRAEAAGNFGRRLRSGAGTFGGAALGGLATGVGTLGTLAVTGIDLSSFLISLVPDLPVVTVNLATIGLGILWGSGVITLSAWHFLILAGVLTLIAWAYRERRALRAELQG
jgi:hypothetical protein